MILRRIQLENFGLYGGRCELDLVPRRQLERSSIILIGGKNGAGKTTLLEAVRLALYGRRALGARVGQTEYEDYLRQRVHRDAAAGAAAVGLEFDYAEAGVVHRYQVRREWAVRGKSVVETLLVEKDGATIASVPREEWHHFLQELIPPGVSQLFFFDGEKIREIAEAGDDNEQLAEAIRGLLGIELVTRLRTDLGLYLARNQRAANDGVASRLEAVVRDLGTLEQQMADLFAEVAELTSTRESHARQAEQIRRRFVAEGGDVAMHRSRLETERDNVRRQLAHAEQELRELANRLLPFALAPRLISRFRAALAVATAGDDQGLSQKRLASAVRAWRDEKKPRRTATWTAKHWADLTNFTKSLARDGYPAPSRSPAFKEVGDGSAAVARLAEVETVIRPRAIALGNDFDTLAARLRELDAALARADAAASGLLLDELRLAEQRVGATEETLKGRQENLKALQGKRIMLEREKQRLLEEQNNAVAASQRADLAVRAAQALADYEQRLLKHKLAQLRTEFVHRFNLLARKSDLISDIQVNPETFATTLIDKTGRVIQKAALSAGEQQVYAIAMLWALARTSGRPLPMIIDTPLARLDSEHRANLIERYFAAASHQVVLLSTDTEVDETLLASLGASVSHTYRLDYDTTSARTVVVPGYFKDTHRAGEGERALQQA